MKRTVVAFQFASYREFLREALKANGFTYVSFAAKHKEIVGSATLAAALSRGRTGMGDRPARNISPETLARIGKALKLDDRELTYLLLLKLENDGEAFSGLYGSVYLDCMRKLIPIYKSSVFDKHSTQKTKIKHSETASTVAQLLDFLPAGARSKILQRIIPESKAFLGRQKNKPGIKPLHKFIDRLEALSAMGGP